MLLLGFLLCVESPRWLLSKGKRTQDLKNLSWLRNFPIDDIYMLEEVIACDTSIEAQTSSVGLCFWQPFKTVFHKKKIQHHFLLDAALFFWQNDSGIKAIGYYSPTIFKSIGIMGTNTSLLTTGIFGVVKTVFTVI
jgi:hypothetical protein